MLLLSCHDVGWQPSTPDAPITQAQAFSLHSRPNATRKIVLDFDGNSVKQLRVQHTPHTAGRMPCCLCADTARMHHFPSCPAGCVTTGTAWNAQKGMPTITTKPYDKVLSAVCMTLSVHHHTDSAVSSEHLKL